MKRFHPITMFASLCLAMLGCSESGLVDVQTESQVVAVQQDAEVLALSKNEIKYVPYKESGSGGPTTDPLPDLPPECGAGTTEIFGKTEATVSHLGEVIGYDHLCLDFSVGLNRVSTIYFTSNGDSIFKTALCPLTHPTEFRCEITVIGGTGRFENASTPPGEPIVKTGTFDPATGISVWTAEGRISSVGSSK